MPSEQFKIGDVVQLMSGGPIMTVVRVEKDNCYFCQWFDNKDIVHERTFPANALSRTRPHDPLDFLAIG